MNEEEVKKAITLLEAQGYSVEPPARAGEHAMTFERTARGVLCRCSCGSSVETSSVRAEKWAEVHSRFPDSEKFVEPPGPLGGV